MEKLQKCHNWLPSANAQLLGNGAKHVPIVVAISSYTCICVLTLTLWEGQVQENIEATNNCICPFFLDVYSLASFSQARTPMHHNQLALVLSCSAIIC